MNTIIIIRGSANMSSLLQDGSRKRAFRGDIRSIYIVEFFNRGMTLEFARAALKPSYPRGNGIFSISSLALQDKVLNLFSPDQLTVVPDVGVIENAVGAAPDFADDMDLQRAVGVGEVDRGRKKSSSTASRFLSIEEEKSPGKRVKNVHVGD